MTKPRLALLRRRILAAPVQSAIIISMAFFCLAYMGVFTHLAERDYHTEFSYPLEVDVYPLVQELRSSGSPSQEIQSIPPINVFNFSYLKSCRHKCAAGTDPPRLLFVIKSALPHFERRMAIRQTWGNERRFPDVTIRTVFLLGKSSSAELQLAVDEEYAQHLDLVQADFVDAYGNNTLKTMSGLKWAVEHCPSARFVVFSDDDMFISTKNLLRFVRDPFNYPPAVYDQVPVDNPLPEHRERSLKQEDDDMSHPENELEEDDDLRLYAGYVFHSPPLRHRSSKWYVSLAEYPFHLWPPYVTAGAYVLSRSALLDLHYGSRYTQYFRFDDVFLGLVARKARIEPVHCPEFYFWKKPYNPSAGPLSYRNVIASHGYGKPEELRQLWIQQKSAGFA